MRMLIRDLVPRWALVAVLCVGLGIGLAGCGDDDTPTPTAPTPTPPVTPPAEEPPAEEPPAEEPPAEEPPAEEPPAEEPPAEEAEEPPAEEVEEPPAEEEEDEAEEEEEEPPPPPSSATIDSFTTPTLRFAGTRSVTVSFKATGVETMSLEIEPMKVDAVTVTVPLVGAVGTSPTAGVDAEEKSYTGTHMQDGVDVSTTFTLVVTDAMGGKTSESIEVTVIDDQAKINSFTKSTPAAETNMVTLSWETTDAMLWKLMATTGTVMVNRAAGEAGLGVKTGESMAVTPSVTTTYTLKATGKNGEPVFDEVQVLGQDESPVAAAVLTFTGPFNAVADSVELNPPTVTEGVAFFLKWTTNNTTTSVTITAAPGGSVTKPAAGDSAEFTLNRLDKTVYTIRANGPGDGGVSPIRVTVDVEEAPEATITGFEATDPATVTDDPDAYGRDVTLTWTVALAKEVTLLANGVSITIDDDLDEDGGGTFTQMVTPIETTTYQVTATSNGQNQKLTESDLIHVAVREARPPSIGEFTSDPDVEEESVEPDMEVKLTWMDVVADELTFTASTGGTLTVTAADGTFMKMVKPFVTTDYTLTAIGEGDTGSVEDTVTVTVEAAPGGSFIRTVQNP